jgi:peptidoglycan/LPS O-acetylase OafA/YrhL
VREKRFASVSGPLCSPPTTPSGFRGDINGLRAIAVAAVLGFHFKLAGLEGGFVGVDIFFVLSGFLIYRMLIARLDRDMLSVRDFYLARAKRIVPPLAFMLMVALVAGALFLYAQEYLTLAKHIASSATFTSNLLYWKESGYFVGADQKWLLHTWSLSVEMQFYLIFPLLMIAVRKKWGHRAFPIFLCALTLMSFAVMCMVSAISPRTGFFLLPTRIWEMSAGSIAAILPSVKPRWARPSQLAGLAMILITILFATNVSWPDHSTLAPVLGTALVLWSGRGASKITDNLAVRWIGLRSYSIYLWHWPVAVLLKRSSYAGASPSVACAIAGSLLLGHLSYHFIEQGPSRRGPRGTHRPAAMAPRSPVAMGMTVLVLVVASGLVWTTRGVPARFSPDVGRADRDAIPGSPFSERCFSPDNAIPQRCVVGGHGGGAAVTMLGDSHADAQVSALVAALPRGTRGGVAFNGYASCAPVIGGDSTDPESECRAFNDAFLLPETRDRTAPLVLSAYWINNLIQPKMTFTGGSARANAEEFKRHFLRTSCALAAAGPTYIVLPTPEFPFSVARELQDRLVGNADAPEITMPVSIHFAKSRAALDLLGLAAKRCGIKLLDPVPYLCPAGTCRGSINHRAVYRDEHHISEYGNKLLIPMFKRIFHPKF